MSTPVGSGGYTSTSWTVTSQLEGNELNARGEFVKGFTVYFTTAEGVDGSVFVPMAQYQADTVRAMIAAQAERISAVHNLSG